ncbi:methylated-DNA--[protein]-cysteine S-methyltransferase [Collimonas fungivorans]|uniref:Adenosine deaminase n=1 Tax=Collimonas fungivorans (strain Ter331) TaxID=1005048 RepID=G0ACW0_COLFT|nr:methylated-DNA--[protein]-cysteine S-methyltransferase [Collimonas fungivorans]AEK63065.1 Adenosine deaminase [Collimonas fungivorans Ter331]
MNTLHNAIGPAPYLRQPQTAVEEEIHYAIGNGLLGKFLAARTSHGICAIMFGDDEEVLVTELARGFPKAKCILSDHALQELLTEINTVMAWPEYRLSQPLDIGGTSFQQQVWQALLEIPAGATASYQDIANRLGKPDAVRAVAGACAANLLALAIPCHRVIRQDGDISGYRWGVQRKQALLQREAQA